jgi:hypothetical protein
MIHRDLETTEASSSRLPPDGEDVVGAVLIEDSSDRMTVVSGIDDGAPPSVGRSRLQEIGGHARRTRDEIGWELAARVQETLETAKTRGIDRIDRDVGRQCLPVDVFRLTNEVRHQFPVGDRRRAPCRCWRRQREIERHARTDPKDQFSDLRNRRKILGASPGPS